MAEQNELVPILLTSRAEGYSILAALSDIIRIDNYATVVDLFRLVRIETTPVQYRYGWSSVDDFRVVENKDGGYELKVPMFHEIPQIKPQEDRIRFI